MSTGCERRLGRRERRLGRRERQLGRLRAGRRLTFRKHAARRWVLVLAMVASGGSVAAGAQAPAVQAGGQITAASTAEPALAAAPTVAISPPQFGTLAASRDLGEDFVLANAAYEGGRFAEAARLLAEVVARGGDTGDVHFNLGNAYLRAGQLGQAVAEYLRAQAMLPRDQDVEANLAFARSSTRDAIEPPAPPPALRTLFFWHWGLSRDELIRITVVLNGLLWAALAGRLWRRQSQVLRWIAILSAAMLLAFGSSLVVRLLRPARVAVVVPQEIDVRAANSTTAVARFKLHAGTEVRVADSRPGWLRVVLPDGESGWLPTEHAELVRN